MASCCAMKLILNIQYFVNHQMLVMHHHLCTLEYYYRVPDSSDKLNNTYSTRIELVNCVVNVLKAMPLLHAPMAFSVQTVLIIITTGSSTS